MRIGFQSPLQHLGEKKDTEHLFDGTLDDADMQSTIRNIRNVKLTRLSTQRSSCLPDENNVVALQEELKQMKLRELEMLRSFREMQDTVSELNQRWQVSNARTHARRLK